MKKMFCFFAFLFFASCSFGQTLHFITIDPYTGDTLSDNALPGIQAIYSPDITFSIHKQFYVFAGTTGPLLSETAHLYVLSGDGTTIVSQSNFNYLTLSDTNLLVDLQYDNNLNNDSLLAYAIDNTYPGFQTYFGAVNVQTGAFTKLSQLQFTSQQNGTNSAAFDENDRRYVFIGNYLDTIKLFSLDASTGATISSPVIIPAVNDSNQLGWLAYYPNSNTLYGMHRTPTRSFYLCSINTATGNYIDLDSIPDVQYVMDATVTLDYETHKYYFAGKNREGETRLFSIDTSGAIATSTSLFSGDTTKTLNYLSYNDKHGELYGFVMENIQSAVSEHTPTAYQLTAYPNPLNDRSTIQLDKNYSTVSAVITNTLGQIVRTDVLHSASEINTGRSNLPDGLYFIHLTADGKPLGTVKLGVE